MTFSVSNRIRNLAAKESLLKGAESFFSVGMSDIKDDKAASRVQFLVSTVKDNLEDLGLLLQIDDVFDTTMLVSKAQTRSHQGLDVNKSGKIFWSQTDKLVRVLLDDEKLPKISSWEDLEGCLVEKSDELATYLGSYMSLPQERRHDELLLWFHLTNALIHKNLRSRMERKPHAQTHVPLPDHFTSEQRSLALECYNALRNDYQQRLEAMTQRLNVLRQSLGEGALVDTPIFRPELSAGNLADEMMRLRVPHSLGKLRSSADAELQLNLRDRGGRVTEKEHRVPAMPTWKSERAKSVGSSKKKGGSKGKSQKESLPPPSKSPQNGKKSSSDEQHGRKTKTSDRSRKKGKSRKKSSTAT